MILIYVICFCLHVLVFNTFCVVFFFMLCALSCRFLWIVHFWLLLWYALTFIYCLKQPHQWCNCRHARLEWGTVWVRAPVDYNPKTIKLLFEFKDLIQAHELLLLFLPSLCTLFRGLFEPTKSTKIVIQWIQMNSQ
jgi:hypothetical protein